MNEYYYIPQKKPRVPRFISIIDIIALIAAAVLAFILIPIDLSVGISGTSHERAEGIRLLVHENGVEPGYFDKLFKTGTRETAVQTDSGYGTYMIYMGNKYRSFDYESGQRTIFGRESRDNVPEGFITGSGLIAYENGSIYYENFEGFYGSADVDIFESVNTDGNPDYEKITELLVKSKEESVSLLEAAAIYHYMQNGTVVGYADGVAWYVIKADSGENKLVCDTVDEPMQTALNLGEYGEKAYVIENNYLMYVTDGKLFLYQDNDNKKTLDCGGEVLGLNYSVADDGKVTVYVCTASQLFRLDMTGNGVEYDNLRIDDIETPDGMYVTQSWNKTLCWLRYGENYSIYES